MAEPPGFATSPEQLKKVRGPVDGAPLDESQDRLWTLPERSP